MFGPRTSPGIEPPQPAVPLTGVPGGAGFVEPDVHVLDRLHVLYKFRKAMISVILLVVIAGVVQTYTTTPAYMGTAQVRVEPDTPSISAAAAAQQMLANYDPEAFMQTELSVLGSRDLKLKVVRRLNLDKDESFLAPTNPQGIDGALAALRGRVMQPLRSLLNRAQPAAPPAAPSDPVTVAANSQETPAQTQAIDVLAGNLNVQPRQASHLFVIDYSSSLPAMAATIANALAEEYVTQNLSDKRAKIDDQLNRLNALLADADARIQTSQKVLIDTASRANVLDADTVNRMVSVAQSDLTARTREMRAAEIKAKDMALLDPEKDLETALNHPEILQTVGQIRSQINELRRQRTALLSSGRGAGHPDVTTLNGQIENASNNLKLEIRRHINAAQTAYQTAVSQHDTADREYRAQLALQVENSQNGIPYQSLRERVTADQSSRNQMLGQKNELDILAKGIENNIKVIEKAPIPQRAYKPDASRNILISLAVGIALAFMLAFALDYMDDTIKTPEDVTRKLHIPFLGLVPAVRGDRQPVLSGPVPHDFGEAYRALRTSLVFTSGGESTRIITVTSAQPLEGKTTTACNLAMVLAFGGSRVLLVDADMRRPGIHKTLKMTNTVGLSHLLVGQARVREAIQRTSDPNFCVMTAGRTPPNPSELLASERMKQLIANLKQGPFDWVVIDTPPVLAVTDAVILTPLVDGVTFVLGAEMTRRRLAERAVQMLMASRPRVIGGVLNRVNFDRNKYYYSRYYGYQYKSYYGTDAAGAHTKA